MVHPRRAPWTRSRAIDLMTVILLLPFAVGNVAMGRAGTVVPTEVAAPEAATTAVDRGRATDIDRGRGRDHDLRQPKIYVAFLWHMHQPIYWPDETITQTAQNPLSTDAVFDYLTWPDRVGAYTHYPISTIGRHAWLPHMGAQVSFSGSLIENLNDLAAHGIGYDRNWAGRYREARSWMTVLGNPRLDLVAFGYHHPLMPLIEYEDIRRQIADHRRIIADTFGGAPSRGIFPPENAFSTRIIPALVDEGIEWVLVDNIHFDRANIDYPWTPQQKILPPNRADARNPAQPHYEALTCQQNTVNMVSMGLGLRPHWAEYVDPTTGEAVTPDGRRARMIVVPTERSIGYDDSYGDRDPIDRLKQLEPYNTDPRRPFLVVLAHDGDNAGASGHRYYLETCEWISRHPDRYEVVTIQDYLTLFPPPDDDLIHVEDGSWTGADLGCAEFKMWNGDPYYQGQVDQEKGYSPDRNSWAVITAARNRLLTAENLAPSSEAVAKAWRDFMVGTTSCYWYWDGTLEWDQKPTIAANNVAAHTDPLIAERLGQQGDRIPPSIWIPQRYPYNPGAPEGAAAAHGLAPESSDFTVWSLVYDVSGLASVELRYRVTDRQAIEHANLVYDGGVWQSIPMRARSIPCAAPDTTVARHKADQYEATIGGLEGVLVDYYVAATDPAGNTARSPLRHVWVGERVVLPDLVSPAEPTVDDVVTISSRHPGHVHWGINGWQLPPSELWPADSTPWPDGKAVHSRLIGPDDDGTYVVRLGPFRGIQPPVQRLDFVIRHENGAWGSDHQVVVTVPAPGAD